MRKLSTRLYKAILMDVGSTLLEYRPEQRTQEWARILGVTREVVEAAWLQARGVAPRLSGYETREEYDAFRTQISAATIEAVGFGGDRRSAIAAMSDAWINLGWEPYPDVCVVLPELRASGYRLGVVSNWTVTLEATLASLGLATYFDVVACSAVVGATKPDPMIFEYALAGLGIEPAGALYVGDHYEADVLGASGAGVDSVLIERNGPSGATPANVTTIRSLDELRALLETGGARYDAGAS